MKIIPLSLFLFICFSAFAQDQIEADCENAVEVILTRDNRVVETRNIPKGPGAIQEIQSPARDPYYFRKEHHTAWYKFRSPFSGIMTFEVAPFDPENDYDFLLFKDTTGNICPEIKQKNILPIRSVISRNDLTIESKTGLSAYYEQNNIHSGPGESYGQSIKVKKGERYYLVLDNVYGDGSGHKITFSYYYRPKIKGTVMDASTEKPIRAQVWVEEIESGRKVDSTFSDSISGRYRMNRPLEYDKEYQIAYKSPDYFDLTKSFKPSRENPPINAALFPRKVGANIVLKELLFRGNQAVFLPRSKPELRRLLAYMKTYPSLVIEVEGHVNAAKMSYQSEAALSIPRYQNLSEARAKAVKNFLVKNSIDPARITTKGYGATKMLYPITMDDFEMQKNRRVEIKIVAF